MGITGTSLRRCPKSCKDRAIHEEYFRRLAEWRQDLLDKGLPVTTEHIELHSPKARPGFPPGHDAHCPLLFGVRSIVRELASSMAVVLDVSPDAIREKFVVTCVPSIKRICQTLTYPQGSRPRKIQFSHGYHFFSLNTSLLVSAFMRETRFGVPSPVPLAEAKKLFRDQMSYFWKQKPADAVLFPYYRFDHETHADASELTFMMIAFMMGHEMAHPFVPVDDPTYFSDAIDASERIVDYIPPPFLDDSEDWKPLWIKELQCDALSAMSILSCGAADSSPLAGAPSLAQSSIADRYLGIEAWSLNLEALYWAGIRKGSDIKDFRDVFSKSHPLPNIRRMYLRGFAEQFVPNYQEVAKIYETVLRKLSPMPDRNARNAQPNGEPSKSRGDVVDERSAFPQ